MLEAQVLIHPGHKNDALKSGDIFVVALEGHPWGTGDSVHFLIVKWEDSDLERILLNRAANGEQWPVSSFPYAIPGKGSRVRKMERLSTKTIRIPRSHRHQTHAKPILKRTEYEMVGFVGQVKSLWKWLTK